MVLAHAISQPERKDALPRQSHFRQRLPEIDGLHPPREFPFTLIPPHEIHFAQRGRALLRNPEEMWADYNVCCLLTLKKLAEGYEEAKKAGLNVEFQRLKRRKYCESPPYLRGYLGIKKRVVVPRDQEQLLRIKMALETAIANAAPHYVYGAYIGRIAHMIGEHREIRGKIDAHPLEDLSVFGVCHIIHELAAGREL